MPKILTLTDSLSERAGGLSHATLNLAVSTAQQWPEAEFSILSQKDSSEIHCAYQHLSNLRIQAIQGFRNELFPWSRGLPQAVEAWQPDLIHLRGLWRQPSLVSLRWKQQYPHKPLIVQTAGMLEPWARSRKRWLKSAYYHLVEQRLIEQCDLIHATSEQEVATLKRLGIEASRIILVEEGVFLPSIDVLQASASGRSTRRLLFLSRLHPVKGVELLLEALSMLRPRGWVCQICGMGQSDYELKLRSQVARLHLGDLVHFSGPLSGKAKQRVLAQADAFVLPSFSESFGIAIAEAMSWGLPVVTTTSTPWQVLADQDMGWCIPPSLNGLSEALFELFNSSDSRLSSMGYRSHQYIAQHYDWRVISQRMIGIYQSLLGFS